MTPRRARASDDTEFTEYARSRAPWLRKVAYLLCGDWHRADDLVQTTVTKLYTNWQRAQQVSNLDAYARKTLVNAFLAEQRTSWRRLVDLRDSSADREPAAPDDDRAGVLDLREALARLPRGQRVAIVLRYYCDLPVAEVATTLGCSEGNVKSQTARGIDTLRELLRNTETPILISEA